MHEVDEHAGATERRSQLSYESDEEEDEGFGELGVDFLTLLAGAEPSLTMLRDAPLPPTDPAELERVGALPLRRKHMWMLEQLAAAQPAWCESHSQITVR